MAEADRVTTLGYSTPPAASSVVVIDGLPGVGGTSVLFSARRKTS
jgi:hypothetical protein